MTSSNAMRGVPLPAVGRGLPSFTLTDTAGVSRRLWDYKQRRPVLLTVLRDAEDAVGRGWLRRLTAGRRALDEHCAAVLVIAAEPVARLRALQSGLDLPFTLLADPTGEVTPRYLPASSKDVRVAAYLADRYLQCLGVFLASDERELPPLDDLLATLALADQDDCACGLPAWPEA